MGQRSRKRGRRSRPPGAPVATAPSPPPAPRPAAAPAPSGHRSRGEERNAAVRATLEPLAPGERPWSLRIAVLLALLSGGGQLLLFVLGIKLRVAGTHAKPGPTIVFGLLMIACAAGMWTLKYQALLGFLALLGITIAYFALALIRVSSVLGLVIALAGVGGGGWLFFKLVRVLSRIQMPRYPGR